VKHEGGLDEFSKGYQKRGFVIQKDGVLYKEWVPNASQAFLVGDFSKLFLKLLISSFFFLFFSFFFRIK